MEATLNVRTSEKSKVIPVVSQQQQRPLPSHDASISLQEYIYYAKISRNLEAHVDLETSIAGGLFAKIRKKRPIEPETTITVNPINSNEKDLKEESVDVDVGTAILVSEDEWDQAARAARTATWSAVFYLVTTDIMGPYSVPWAMTQLGYGPGISLYIIFGVLAGWTGYLLWHMFLQLDSNRYPLRTYGDVAFRIYGPWARHSVNALQSIQIVFNVGLVIISNSQGLAQVTKGKLCFSVICLIWGILGVCVGQIRTLAKLSYFTNCAIWMNLLVMFITMGVVAHSTPYYEAALASNGVAKGPVITSAGLPVGTTFEGQVVGLMQAVYSYGGSMLFCEFMSEMRRPWDFWKALICAQTVILTIYLTFGIFVYSYQGQFSINPAGQGISIYAWQTAVNVIGMLATLISGVLYGNIGMKVIYQNLIKEVMHGPELTERRGKWIWAALVPAYWSLAFVIASAIPQFSNVSGLVGAACILQFTYTFPPLLKLGFDIQVHSLLPGEGFNPVTKLASQQDKKLKRWLRGVKKEWYFKLWLLIFFLGSAATAALGIFSSIKAIITGFTGSRAVTGFGCESPLGG